MIGGASSIFKRATAALAVCLAFLLAASPATAAHDLVPCISAVRTGDSVQSAVADPARFDCTTAQSNFTAGDYWVRMDVPLSSHHAGERPIFRIASLWDEGFALTAFHADGSVMHYDFAEIEKRANMRLGATLTLMLDGQKPPITTLVAKVRGTVIVRGVLQEPKISAANEAIRYELGMAALYAGLVGLCIAMLVYNIALWRAMRENFLLAYCAMVTVMMFYAFFTSGAVHYFVDGVSGGDRLRITIPLLAITASTGLIFTRYFFEASTIPRWLINVTIAHATAIAAFSLFYAAVAPRYIAFLDQIYLLGFLPVPLIFLAYLWMAWRQKDAYLSYFLLAWSVPFVSAGLRLLHAYGLLPYHILIENSTLLGLAFEALVSSLAIGHRVRLLAQARDRAQNAETNALLMADTDPLTGLLNRRAFLRNILESKEHWSLVLIDIDHFKRVNDSLGHAGGDEALTMIADVFRAYAGSDTLVARMGGEEFAIANRGLMPLLGPDAVLFAIRQIDLPQGYRITASIGVANRVVGNDDDWKILYRAADIALYRAKSSGRDCFVRYSAERAAA